MLKVAHAIGYSHAVKGVVVKWKVKTVALHKLDDVVKACIFGFFAADFQHSFREVNAGNVVGVEGMCNSDGEVAGACSHIKNVGWLIAPHHLHCLGPPQVVDAESHGPVHEIIGRCNRVEHLLHLLGFATIIVVGVDFFGTYFHCWLLFRVLEIAIICSTQRDKL